MGEFITNPNQRRVKIHKMDAANGYTKIDIQRNKQAMADLGYSAYMLYMYFCLNATDFDVIVSKVSICDETGLKETTYHEAFKKLVDKGYMVLKPGKKTLYDFYESPEYAQKKKREASTDGAGTALASKRRNTLVTDQAENMDSVGKEKIIHFGSLKDETDAVTVRRRFIQGEEAKKLLGDI